MKEEAPLIEESPAYTKLVDIYHSMAALHISLQAVLRAYDIDNKPLVAGFLLGRMEKHLEKMVAETRETLVQLSSAGETKH